MIFRIHFEWPDGTPDTLIVSGADIDDIRDQAREAMESRGVDLSTCWSVELEE